LVNSGGGDRLKFSDVILAVASLLLISWSLYPVLAIAFVPLNSNTASDTLSYIICILVGALIVGYVLAPKIHEESKVRAIGSIAVLSTFVMMALLMVWFASPQGNRWFMDSLNSMFNKTTSQWTDYDLTVYSALLETMDTVIALVLSFIGLYVGSMLRKPSAKTKE
jgi:predicted PurR-regulated permease PerM